MPDAPRFGAPGGEWADRDPDHHAALVQPQPAVQRGWLFPAAALCAVALDAAACEPDADQESAVFCFRLEIDSGQPRIAGIDRKTRFRLT